MRISHAIFVAVCGVLIASSPGKLSAQDLPVTDGLQLWLDATDPDTVFEDAFLQFPATFGGPVAGWKDKSPNGYEIFQSDPERTPTYQEDGMSGLPSIRLTGAESDGMEFFDVLLLRPYTVFIANQYWGDVRGRTLQGTDTNWLVGLWSGNVGHYANGWVSTGGGSLPATINTPYVADTVGTFDSSSFFLNGADFTGDPAPLGEPGGLGLASVGMFPGEVSDADVSEIIVYDRALEQSELDSMRAYLYDKYGTQPYEPPPPLLPTVHAGRVGTFTGADPGEGLDFEGEFVYALNVGGPGETPSFEPLTVGDAEFIAGSEEGLIDNLDVTITDAEEILNWHAPAYGDSPDDDNLEFAMQSIRWANRGIIDGLNVDLAVEEGEFYQVQMLFAESCCNRGFDIFIEDEEVVEDLVVKDVQGGINKTDTGVVYTHTIQATDNLLSIFLGGSVDVPDNNGILNALTLELVDELPPPEGIPGDYNGNGTVEQADLDLVLLNWGQPGTPGGWTNDLPDGNIDQAELDGVLLNWGNTAAVGGAGSVPEPSTAILAVCLAVAGLAVRRRCR